MRKKNNYTMHMRVGLLAGIISLMLLAGCSNNPPDDTDFFYAATLVPSITPVTSLSTPAAPSECTDNLNFMEDITLPDGSTIKPGTPLDKRWQVKNTGTCPWTEQYSLRRTSGAALGGTERSPLRVVEPGSIGVLQLELTAPAEAGNYRTSWRAYNDKGLPFGDPIYIDIIVQ